MSKVAIVTDSNSGITQSEAKEYGVTVMPMPFFINDQTYYEDIDLTQEDFYQKLSEDANISTSMPLVGNVTDTWDALLQDYDEIVHIPMSSGLSGSCETAIMLSQDYDGRVQVVNNQRISVTQRQSVLDAKELAGKGYSAEAIKEIAGQVDLIVTTGAVSVGKKDIMHEALRLIGAERIFWRVLMKPGMPTLFSVYHDVPIVSLSGNPFGVAVSVDVLIRPMLHKMTQDETLAIVHKKCVLKNEFSKKIKGRRYERAFVDETGVMIPCGLHSNGVLATMAGCNCLIDMQEGRPGIHAGEEAEVLLL